MSEPSEPARPSPTASAATSTTPPTQPAVTGAGSAANSAAASPAAMRTGGTVALLALFVAAVNLRPAIASISPLVDTIRAGLGLSAVGVALLTTVPTLAMGLCAPLAAAVGRRVGLHTGVIIGLLVITIGTLARAGGASTALQLISAFVAGAGIAVAQTLLPAIVKARFAHRATLVTGLYTAGLGLGAIVAAGATVGLSSALGSWPLALASWAVLGVLGLILWIGARGPLDLQTLSGPKSPATTGLPWGSALAWRITAVSAGNSALYYCELAWVANLLHDDSRYSEAAAGTLLTLMLVVQVIAMLGVPALLGEARDRRVGLVLTTLLTAFGFLGLALAPGTVTILWLLLLGLGHGGLFPLVLALPVSSSRDAAEAGRLSGMAFFVGYGSAAVAPLVVGALRDVAGDFEIAFAVLGIAALLMVWPILRLNASARGAR